jgi:hypothetical protein
VKIQDERLLSESNGVLNMVVFSRQQELEYHLAYLNGNYAEISRVCSVIGENSCASRDKTVNERHIYSFVLDKSWVIFYNYAV